MRDGHGRDLSTFQKLKLKTTRCSAVSEYDLTPDILALSHSLARTGVKSGATAPHRLSELPFTCPGSIPEDMDARLYPPEQPSEVCGKINASYSLETCGASDSVCGLGVLWRLYYRSSDQGVYEHAFPNLYGMRRFFEHQRGILRKIY